MGGTYNTTTSMLALARNSRRENQSSKQDRNFLIRHDILTKEKWVPIAKILALRDYDNSSIRVGCGKKNVKRINIPPDYFVHQKCKNF